MPTPRQNRLCQVVGFWGPNSTSNKYENTVVPSHKKERPTKKQTKLKPQLVVTGPAAPAWYQHNQTTLREETTVLKRNVRPCTHL